MTHSVLIFFCRGGGDCYSTVSIHHTRRARTGGATVLCSLLMTLLRAANWKPCVMHKSVTSTHRQKNKGTPVSEPETGGATIVSFESTDQWERLYPLYCPPHDAICAPGGLVEPVYLKQIVFRCPGAVRQLYLNTSEGWWEQSVTLGLISASAWRDMLPILVLMLLRGICDASWQAWAVQALSSEGVPPRLPPSRLHSSLVCSDLFSPVLVTLIFFNPCCH